MNVIVLVQVWISFAKFELSVGDENCVAMSRSIYKEAHRRLKNADEKEERLLLLEAWKDFEVKIIYQTEDDQIPVEMRTYRISTCTKYHYKIHVWVRSVMFHVCLRSSGWYFMLFYVICLYQYFRFVFLFTHIFNCVLCIYFSGIFTLYL